MTPCQDVFPTMLAGLIPYLRDYLCIRVSESLGFQIHLCLCSFYQ